MRCVTDEIPFALDNKTLFVLANVRDILSAITGFKADIAEVNSRINGVQENIAEPEHASLIDQLSSKIEALEKKMRNAWKPSASSPL